MMSLIIIVIFLSSKSKSVYAAKFVACKEEDPAVDFLEYKDQDWTVQCKQLSPFATDFLIFLDSINFFCLFWYGQFS